MAKVWGEHGEKTHGFFIYNATMHVPLIIRLPENRLPENAAARDGCRSGFARRSDAHDPALLSGWRSRRRCKDAACFPSFALTALGATEVTKPPATASSMEKPSCHGFTSTGVNCAARRTLNIISSMRLGPELYDLAKTGRSS